MKDVREIIRWPLLTEKVNLLKENFNQIGFNVDSRANKVEIRKAVEKIFKVKVVKVNTLNQNGKKKRWGRVITQRSSWKKAYVTLAPGQGIDFFEGA